MMQENGLMYCSVSKFMNVVLCRLMCVMFNTGSVTWAMLECHPFGGSGGRFGVGFVLQKNECTPWLWPTK